VYAFEATPCLHAGLAPEKIHFLEEGGFRVEEVDTGNVLRPETVESLYYMWRLTGEQRYREWGWEIFQAFQDHAKGEAGYHSLLVRELSSFGDYKSPSSGAYRRLPVFLPLCARTGSSPVSAAIPLEVRQGI